MNETDTQENVSLSFPSQQLQTTETNDRKSLQAIKISR